MTELAPPLWRTLCEAAAEGRDAPPEDRWVLEQRGGDGAAAYGEIRPQGAARLLRWLALGPQDRFYDLGSGIGRLVVQAACTTAVGRAVGVELSAFRHAAALELRAALLAALPAAEAAALAPRLELRHEDFTRCDASAATVVYAGSTLFSEELLRSLAERALEAPRLRALITARPLPAGLEGRLEELGRVRTAMTWSAHERVVVYRPR